MHGLLRLPGTLLWLYATLLCSSTAIARSVPGDSWCGDLMCVTAFVNESVVTYRLAALAQLGWMAVGFGTQMSDSAMIILWPNSDGNVTLSQRTAPGLVEPNPDSSPPRIASVYQPLASVESASPSLAFTVPKNSDTNQSLIWALGSTNPASSDPDATLVEHLSSGAFTLDLTKEIDTDSGNSAGPSTTFYVPPGATSFSTTPSSSASLASQSIGVPLSMYEKLIFGHATLSVIGFLFILPIGALIARWGRVFTTRWFHYHWVIQAVLSVPVIVIGWSLGPLAVAEQGEGHVNDTHKICGILLLPLYLAQLCLGSFIHFRRPGGSDLHPPQNFLHAALGITIIGLAFFQARIGFVVEWTKITGRSIDIRLLSNLWIAWVIFIPTLYLLGLFLLPRQLASEREMNPSVDQTRDSALSGLRGLLELGPKDDGTHGIYSEQAASESTETSYGIEMRELEHVIPVSLASSR